MASQIIFTDNLGPVLAETVEAAGADRCVIITDTNVARLLPADILPGTGRIVIAPGDSDKSIATASEVWEAMTRAGLSRHSLAVNIGGGMVTDLGGFADSFPGHDSFISIIKGRLNLNRILVYDIFVLYHFGFNIPLSGRYVNPRRIHQDLCSTAADGT